MSKVRPWPVRRPAVLRWAARSWLLMVGPSRLMTLTACGTVLCLGHGGESGLPSGFQASGHEAVLGLAGVEGAFGPVGVVTGAFHGELRGPADPLVPAGDLVGGAQCERDLFGESACSRTAATAVSTVAATTDRQVGVVARSAREL